MDPLGDILLNGKPYRIDLTSYREKDLADFSPRAAVAGNSITQSELMLYQPLYLTDWRHGLGFLWNTDAMGYMQSMGSIDTRQPGIVMLFSAPTFIADDNKNKYGIAKFNGNIYTWGESGLRKYTIGTGLWSSIYATGPVNFALATETYLFFCPDGAQLKKMDTSDVVTDTGDASADDFKWLTIHKGFVYGGIDATSRIHYASAADLSDMHGTAVADPAAITVGAGGFGISGSISWGNELYLFRKDGVWVLGADNQIARRVLDFSGEASTSNFKGFTIFNSYLYFTVRNKIYQWNGSRIVDVTPPRMSDQFPYSEIRTVGPMVVANNFLYVLANWYNNPTDPNIPGIGTAGATYTSLFCYDGVGWHKLADLMAAGGLPQTSSLFVDGDANRLYFSIDNSTEASSKVGYFPLGETTLPATPFPTGATNVLVSSRLDMGFRRVDKVSPSLLVEASNILYNASSGVNNRWLTISAVILGKGTREEDYDTVQWFAVGNIVQNGVTELQLPGMPKTPTPPPDGGARLHVIGTAPLRSPYDSARRTIEPIIPSKAIGVYKYIILVVSFFTNSATQTPILEGLTLRFLLRPDVFYGYNFNIVAATDAPYGENQDTRTAGEIVSELKALRNYRHPIPFSDIYGLQHQVYISSVTLSATERHEDSNLGQLPNVESMINVNVVEAK